MLSKKYFLALWSTTVLVTISSQSSFAFTLTPGQPGDSDGTFRHSQWYENRQGLVSLDAWPEVDPRRYLPQPGVVHTIRPGGTDGLLYLLNNQFGRSWEFIPKGDIEGSFNVENYYTCNPDFACEADGVRIFNSVGAFFKLNYFPKGNDPVGSTVHWIQRVLTNYDVDNDGNIINEGIPLDKLDIRSGARTPYYDESFPGSNSTTFRDLSHVRGSHTRTNHYFYAETYLVNEVPGRTTVLDTGIVKQRVEIYNGVRWGWENKFGSGLGWRRFFGNLSSGTQVDKYKLDGLTPGSKYIAWTNNDLPSNRCNPNTFLSTHNDSGFRLGFDDNSSRVGNGFASALTGTVGSSGNINLDVRAAGGGARGQDRGNYELFVDVYDPQESPDFSSAASGGGGFGKEMRGLTQQNPILPNSIENGWQVFNKVPGCRWFDPPTTYGFEFQSLEDTLFTEILDFPAGDDQEFTVAVGDSILGNFSPGDKLDFVSLLGYPVDNFRITGIDSLFGPTAETAFPIQLAFGEREGSFKMRQISRPIDAEAVPEPGSILAAHGMLLWFAAMRHILRKHKQV